MHLLISLLLGFLVLQVIPENEDRYSIMYFYNPDCPACQEIAPFIDYLKEEYETAIYSYNMRNPVGFRYGMQHEIRYVPAMIIQIERGEEKIVKRYQGIQEIKDAEEEIAMISNKKESAGN